MFSVTPRRLEVFVSVVETGGFGAAAEALDISQPSVSSHMRALEKLAGTDLFERHPGTSPQLTEAGKLLYAYARETIDRANAIEVQLGRLPRTLRFAAQRFVASSLLAKPLEAFSAACPGVEVVARTGTFEEVQALYTSGAVDLVFFMSDGEVPDIDCTAMGRYRLAFLAAATHPLASRERISVQTLASHPFISAYRGSYFGRCLDNLLRQAGFPTPLQGSQAQEFSVVRDMVLAGMGVSLSLRRSVQKDLAAGTIVELDVDVEPMYLTLHYARNPKAAAAEIDSLVEMVMQAERKSLPTR